MTSEDIVIGRCSIVVDGMVLWKWSTVFKRRCDSIDIIET